MFLKLTKADHLFYENLKNIKDNGVKSGQARPKYANGETAHSYYVTQVFNSYDLSKGEFPITTLRRIAVKTAIKEMCWIYQDMTNSLDILENKYGVLYWQDWEVEGFAANNGDMRSIGARYGYTVKKHDIMNKILRDLESNPFNRRSVISLWDYEAFKESDGLYPCAFNIMFDVRDMGGVRYLDCTLTQRSGDIAVAHHINAMQYVSLQMMVACHFGWELGKFGYFINNLHVYDNQTEQVNELMRRYEERFDYAKGYPEGLVDLQPKLILKCPKGTNFFDIRPEDFELVDYEPMTPQLKFDLAI